ncbi:contactin-associated protein-like 5 [Xyrichtys novacula]|uniref:Contactin-associated protein-like 5 n=1 Tax=Xyrichtys novacula TaxID=13765 RepID=A0AAV1GZA0_XYRNO|nr:contactin-associated protein-like 5 [Xyrichtys novacula]
MDLFLLLCGLYTITLINAVSAASHYNCNSPLVSSLPQSSFRSSSQSSYSSAAHNAKINRRDGAGGWSPVLTDREPWLQLDLREQVEVTAVATQGRSASLDWVSRYLLLYSDTGQVWRQYRQEDGGGMFVGNVNSESIVQNKLSPSVKTRFLRFVPLDWNPSGWLGLRVEVYGCSHKSDVVDFDGRSSLLYRFNQKSMSTVKDVISLRFKSRQAEGVLLHGEGQRGDYITLELHRGKLALYLNLDDNRLRYSSSRVAVTVGSLLDDQQWHSVLIERFNRHVNLSVDSHTEHFTTRGEGDSLEVNYELSFGGIPLPGKPGTFLRRNFQGCIENLYYNGINIIDLAKRRKPQIYSVGNVTFSCSRPTLAAVTFLSSSSSFLSLPLTSTSATMGGFSVQFQFRTWNPDGLLLSVRLNRDNQRLDLQIRNQRLILTLQEAGEHRPETSAGHRVNDGLWHSVSLDTRGLQVSLTLDSEPASTLQQREQLEATGSFYFGGCPPADCHNPTLSFQGCMRLIAINSQNINLHHVQQGMLGVYQELQFETCTIRDRCLPNLCEHGGLCQQTWSSFSCDCSGSGYSGAVCHSAVYDPSCEAIRLRGGSSAFYSIDPDGSGPLGPMKVYCNMTDERVWTVVSHNVSTPVRVQGSSLLNPHIMTFNYSSTPNQLHTIISASEHCQQEVVYSCRKSRLFNPKDGRPLAWWVDQSGERRSYWGGFLPAVQQCSCKLEETCMDRNYFCNCDADSESWANDTGVLSYKNHLPVNHMVIGDTNRAGSEAVYTIGPLQCYGDRWIWNAASFFQESSSLIFPALQAELSSDFSFFFKTSAPSGVFLENLGHKDFIRLELNSPSVVMFSFDVGNGPVVLTVNSPLPLNDRQWHHIRAERNVKEAWLQVDQLPPRLLEAPADGHRRLRLSGQLFVGGSASQLRGFLGCMRTLVINGVTFDLEERARAVPGVSSGCPGYCSGSSSLCHNRGRCIERSSGYACDCSTSAYGGPTCREEVSASLDRESSLTFVFQEPFSVVQNRSFGTSGVSRESASRAREDIAFSFMTTHSPALLLTVNTFSQQYIAVILMNNGSLQIWYHLQTHRNPDVFSPVFSSLADGRLHRIRIHREDRDLYIQIDQDVHRKFTLSSDAELISIRSLTLGKVIRRESFHEDVVRAGSEGFVGCLSSVQFNHVAPLKAALLNRGSSLVTIRGSLVQSNCGAPTNSITSHNLRGNTQDDSAAANEEDDPQSGDKPTDVAVIAGVVTAVVFITVCVLVVVTRLLYLRQVQKATPTLKQHHHSIETPNRTELHTHNPARDNMKEFYI